MPLPKDEAQRAVARMRVGQAHDNLQAAIRADIGADTLGEATP
jgi:hypothetical protein